MDFAAFIPARYASSRFPGKPLAMLGNMTVIERVYRQVNKVVDNVWVATDDSRIADCVKQFGGRVVMTRTDHRSGTDRIIEAVETTDCRADVIINCQGDEPFIAPEQITTLMHLFDDNTTEIATLGKRFDTMEAVENSNSPKIAVGVNGKALYFSRSVIPFVRGIDRQEWNNHYPFLKHIGIYAYRRDALMHIKQLTPTPLEKAESLEQLRWLENGMNIAVGETDIETIGIDTPADLEKAAALLENNSLSNSTKLN